MNAVGTTPTASKGYSPLDCVAGVGRKFPELFAQRDDLRAMALAYANPWSTPPHWYARKQRAVPYRRDAGLESSGADAIKTLEKRTRRVPEAVRLHDYNHREAGVSLLVEENAARADKSTNGIDYRWGEHYETPEEGKQIARRRHEEYLANQITFKGTGNPFWLEAGEVMRVEPAQADAKHGIFVTAVESSGGRSQSYWVTFEGIPSDWGPQGTRTRRGTAHRRASGGSSIERNAADNRRQQPFRLQLPQKATLLWLIVSHARHEVFSLISADVWDAVAACPRERVIEIFNRTGE
ncbi:hypothetical protein WT12_21945 [Burkholderia territorii]|nr:hypothetical protein WT12_21945 [Burkholderia territorii]